MLLNCFQEGAGGPKWPCSPGPPPDHQDAANGSLGQALQRLVEVAFGAELAGCQVRRDLVSPRRQYLRDGDGVIDTWDNNGDGQTSDETMGATPFRSPPPIPDAIAPGLLPWAFTNPIFVDGDGGGWSPPGL